MADEPKHLFALIQRRAELLAALRDVEAQIEAELLALEAVAIERGLSTHAARATVRSMYSAVARVNVSASKSNDDPLIEAANKAGYSIRMLADEVTERLRRQKITCSRTLILSARKGERRIREEIVDAIEAITGLKATPRNWPGGIIRAAE